MARALQSTALYALALVMAKGVSLVMLPVVTAHLDTAEYGVLEVLVSIADIGGLVLGLGLADALFRFGSEPGMPGRLLGFGLLVAMAMLLAGQLLVPVVLSSLQAPIAETDLRLLVATLALTSLIQVPLAYLRYRDRPAVFAGVSCLKAIVQAALVGALLVAGFGVTGVLLGGLLADAAAALMLVFLQARETGVRLDLSALRTVLPYGVPLVLSGVFGFCLGSFDRWILFAEVGPEDLAHYGLAAKFGLVTALAMQPFEMWWFPRRIRMLDRPGGAIRSAETVAIGVTWAVLCASGVATLAPVAIAWLTPPDYHAASRWVPALAAIAGLHAIINLMNVGCYTGRTTWLPMTINAAAAAIAITGYLILIPDHGIAGAIIATFVAQGIRLVAFFWASQHRSPIPHKFPALIAIGGAAIFAFIGTTLLLPDFPLPLAPLAALLTAAACGVLRRPHPILATS